MRALIVDDSALERVLVRNLLQQEGFVVVGEAASGVQAVEQFRLLKPDFALVDLMLPQMSGIEVARAVLTLQPSATLIAMSGLSQPSVQAEADRVGMRGFIIKPVERDELIEEIRHAFGYKS